MIKHVWSNGKKNISMEMHTCIHNINTQHYTKMYRRKERTNTKSEQDEVQQYKIKE